MKVTAPLLIVALTAMGTAQAAPVPQPLFGASQAGEHLGSGSSGSVRGYFRQLKQGFRDSRATLTNRPQIDTATLERAEAHTRAEQHYFPSLHGDSAHLDGFGKNSLDHGFGQNSLDHGFGKNSLDHGFDSAHGSGSFGHGSGGGGGFGKDDHFGTQGYGRQDFGHEGYGAGGFGHGGYGHSPYGEMPHGYGQPYMQPARPAMGYPVHGNMPQGYHPYPPPVMAYPLPGHMPVGYHAYRR